jgi:hypothetical protein
MAVTQRLAVAEHKIEVGVRRIDDDRTSGFPGIVIDQSATELARQFLGRAHLWPYLRGQSGETTHITPN